MVRIDYYSKGCMVGQKMQKQQGSNLQNWA